jgi:structure-specific recognition protein 1
MCLISQFMCWFRTGNNLEFNVENQLAFEIPLVNVSRSLMSKNEVTIEFTPNDDAAVSLVEMRFHVPSDNNEEVDPVKVRFYKKNFLLY